ncbi:MAG: flagellar biosynthetic protein FliO [Planctomycetota bacterium]
MPTERTDSRRPAKHPGQEGHVHRTPKPIVLLGLAALILCAVTSTVTWAQAAPPADVPADAERRLAELAQRYAGDSAEARPERTAEPAAELEAQRVASVALEETPLGASSDAQASLEGIDNPAGGWALSTLAALGIVIGLIFAARWLYTKMGGAVVAKPSPVVEVLSRTPVAPKNHVLLLRVGQRVLVVGDSSSGLNTLADVDDPEEVASLLQSVSSHSDRSVTKSFNALVSRFNGDYDGQTRVALEGGDTSEIYTDRTRNSLSGLTSKLRTLGSKGGVA